MRFWKRALFENINSSRTWGPRTFHFLNVTYFQIERNRALEKVIKEQLIRKRFKIYQTISCFGAFLLTLSMNSITELVLKSIKLATVMKMITKGTFCKDFSNHTQKIMLSSTSLTYFQVQIFPVTYISSKKQAPEFEVHVIFSLSSSFFLFLERCIELSIHGKK